jgi:GNAT superfamily N-acetyltransferase
MRSGSASGVLVLVAGPEHVPALLPLIETHALFERATATCTEETLKAALAEPSAGLLAWLALDERGGPIGYATATREFSTWSGKPFLHLDCLYLTETARGAGVGSLLFDAVKLFATRQGLDELQWQTPDWNVAAERFYLKHGASVTAKRRFRLDL